MAPGYVSYWGFWVGGMGRVTVLPIEVFQEHRFTGRLVQERSFSGRLVQEHSFSGRMISEHRFSKRVN